MGRHPPLKEITEHSAKDNQPRVKFGETEARSGENYLPRRPVAQLDIETTWLQSNVLATSMHGLQKQLLNHKMINTLSLTRRPTQRGLAKGIDWCWDAQMNIYLIITINISSNYLP